jgi:hypothetical protein
MLDTIRFRLFLATFASWVCRRQTAVIAYLIEDVGRQLLAPANARPRLEPRAHWPVSAPCASPQTEIEGQRGVMLALVIGYLEGRRHLPVVALREAA